MAWNDFQQGFVGYFRCLFIFAIFFDTILVMKLKMRVWSLIWRFLVVIGIIYLAILISLNSLFISIDYSTGDFSFVSWDYRQPVILIGVLFLGFIGFIPSITSSYYLVEDKYFSVVRYGKEVSYYYENIEFIDIEKSRKKKMVIFYSSKAKMRYLIGDKEGKLLGILIKKCPNILSLEAFRKKHPEEKY